MRARARARIACLEYEVGYEHVAADEALEDGVARLVPAQHLQPALSRRARSMNTLITFHMLMTWALAVYKHLWVDARILQFVQAPYTHLLHFSQSRPSPAP